MLSSVRLAGFAALAAYVSAQSVSLDYVTLNGATNPDTGLTSYLGIPYADPPTGDLRFRAPVFPPSTNLGDRDATAFGKRCVSSTDNVGDASEDCLFLNVYAPADATPDSNLPVMVWIHGGGFTGGTSHDNPTVLMQSSQSPLIFVSIDYRLGPFGFLGGEAVKGNGNINAGLLDQRAALQWVNKYIGSFGGDNARVTIWGESAGAGSTMFHLVAYGGDNGGLFHQAMGDSASLSFTPTYNDPYVESLYTDFVNAANCGGDDPLGCLRGADVGVLASAGRSAVSARPATIYPFAPIFDGDFFQERPVEAFASGKFAQVPVLFGYNSDEGAGWSAGRPDDSGADTSVEGANEDTVYNFLKGQFDSYPRESFDTDGLPLYPIGDYGGSLDRQVQQMYGEARYICSAPLVNAAAYRNGQPTYQYHFHNPATGSTHGAELQAFFRDKAEPTLFLFKAMREYWTSFVTGGAPVAVDYTEWLPVTNDVASTSIHLEREATVMEEMDEAQRARCDYWHGISAQLNT